ncbi:MAG: SdrD B-like domain-containing protein, partial [Gemmataceae bacterium]
VAKVIVAPDSVSPLVASSFRFVDVGPGQAVTDFNLGFYQYGALEVSIFNDDNGDGIRSETESGRVGVTVFLDSDGDGVRDEGEIQKVTDPSGTAKFDSLIPGSFRIGIEMPAHHVLTSTNNTAIVRSGETTVAGSAGVGAIPDSVAPELVRTEIQDGQIQRSIVNRMMWAFSEAVNFSELIASGNITKAFRLFDVSLSSETHVSLTANQFRVSDDKTTLTWSLDGFEGTYKSLENGNYEWRMDPSFIVDKAGNPLPDSTSTRQSFHRLFGDLNGDRKVTADDQEVIKSIMNTHLGEPGFDPAADLIADRIITEADRLVALRLAGSWTPTSDTNPPILWSEEVTITPLTPLMMTTPVRESFVQR